MPTGPRHQRHAPRRPRCVVPAPPCTSCRHGQSWTGAVCGRFRVHVGSTHVVVGRVHVGVGPAGRHVARRGHHGHSDATGRLPRATMAGATTRGVGHRGACERHACGRRPAGVDGAGHVPPHGTTHGRRGHQRATLAGGRCVGLSRAHGRPHALRAPCPWGGRVVCDDDGAGATARTVGAGHRYDAGGACAASCGRAVVVGQRPRTAGGAHQGPHA